MKKNRKNTGLQKDKLFMIAASVFILTAFTMTGVYVADKNKQEQDGYLIDFSELEQAGQDQKATGQENTQKQESQVAKAVEKEPVTTAANSGKVENPKKNEVAKKFDEEHEAILDADENDMEEVSATVATVNTEPARQYSFSETDTLAWPVVGEVLLNYSMDKAIYFQTMDQYRYNPSVVIAATEGEQITAAADAKVVSVFHDAEIGDGVIFELGDGYELTYGQLRDIAVKEGEHVERGALIGYVAAPTIYYSEEGSNLYVKLTHDGIPVNPLENMK